MTNDWWNTFRSDIPEGKSGKWRVEKYSVGKDDADFYNMKSHFTFSNKGLKMAAGDYTRLVVDSTFGGDTMMSDTRDELLDMREFINRAKGKVLINGLGLGCCLKLVLDKPEVEFVTVIEKEKDVIKLVAPRFLNDPLYKDRVEIILADALEYTPPKGTKYDAVWHDIWLNICADNFDEMSKLHRKYGKRSKWQDSWQREYVKELCGRY